MAIQSYGVEFSKAIFALEPGIASCDPEAVARASKTLASVIGSIIAAVLIHKGEATFEMVKDAVAAEIDLTARETAALVKQKAN